MALPAPYRERPTSAAMMSLHSPTHFSQMYWSGGPAISFDTFSTDFEQNEHIAAA